MSSEIKAEDICSDYCQSDEIISFRALTETKIDFGAGSVFRLVDHVKSLGGSRFCLSLTRELPRPDILSGSI
ncbi:MAG: hypothetical protein MK172_07685 [Verrucomicrobiales bacterium]|nr:hypothetical protein [Verrucomicrobiales bacterium]